MAGLAKLCSEPGHADRLDRLLHGLKPKQKSTLMKEFNLVGIAFQHSDLRTIEVLLRHGGRICAYDCHDRNPFYYFLQRRDIDQIDRDAYVKLLKASVDFPVLRNEVGSIPLLYNNPSPVFDELLKYKARVNYNIIRAYIYWSPYLAKLISCPEQIVDTPGALVNIVNDCWRVWLSQPDRDGQFSTALSRLTFHWSYFRDRFTPSLAAICTRLWRTVLASTLNSVWLHTNSPYYNSDLVHYGVKRFLE